MAWTRRALLAAGVATLAGCTDDPEQTARASLDAGDADARLGFVGDVMLGRGVNDRWVDSDPTGVWGSTLARLRALDGLVLNLECCLSDGGQRWPDKGYYFRANPAFAVPALRAAGAAVVSLANNHALDFGERALADTRTHLADAGVAHAGAGPDRTDAFAPAVTDVGGLTVATIALTGRYQPFEATESGAGTAYVPLDSAISGTREVVQRTVERADEYDPDLLVTTIHWGPNWETAPAPTQKTFARWLVEQGVDVVHGHSAHVLQGIEVYQGRPIIYDTGDFVDDYIHRETVHNKRSALFELVVTDGSLDRLRLVPTQIEDETAMLADETATEWVRETMRERSNPFGTTVERSSEGLSVPLDGN